MVWTKKDKKDYRKEQIRLLNLSALLFLSFLYACSPITSHYILVETNISRHNFNDADSIIEKNKANYGERNAILYELDRGMTLHLAGRYEESNSYLASAEDKIEKLYTRSLTGETGAMLTNDNLLPYEGEDFEKVILNIISALNYAYLNKWDDALVEARKVDHKLNLYNDRYAEKNVYREDAFARYLSGILYEAKGEINDAYIAYQKAYEAFKVYKSNYKMPLPSFIGADLLMVTDALGLPEEHEEYKQEFPSVAWERYKDLKKKGEIIFISYNGMSPVKEDYFIDAPIPDGSGGIYILRVALPRFVVRDSKVNYCRIRIKEDASVINESKTKLVEDINSIAVKNLEDRIGRISTKAVARATAKYMATRKIRNEVAKKNDPLSSFLADVSTNVYSLVSEQSDKRSWRTLPGEIQIDRIYLPPGTYEMQIEYVSNTGAILESKTFPKITIKGGEKRFVNYLFTS